MSKPLHDGPILPLALMAMVALIIPIISIANSKDSVRNSSAKMAAPTNEPYLLVEPTPTTSTQNNQGVMMQY